MKYGVHEYGYILNSNEIEIIKEKLTKTGIWFSDNNDVVEFLGGIWMDDFTGSVSKLIKRTEEDYLSFSYEDDRIVFLPLTEYPSFWNAVFWDEAEMVQEFRTAYNLPEKYKKSLPYSANPEDWLPESDEDIIKNLYEITGITN